MKESPTPVLLYIPLMKDLGMSWKEIKETPRVELEGILTAFAQHNIIHSYDGYSEKDISEMAKNKPEIRKQYGDYVMANRELKRKLGQKEKPKSFSEFM